jgi:hypothetical protein
LGIGAFLTTVLVYTQVSDPVNVPKMVVLATLAFGILGAALFSQKLAFITNQRLLIGAAAFFLFFSMLAVIQSESPFNQNFFGTFGRNTGLLTYLSLVFVMIVVATFRAQESFKSIIWALLASGFHQCRILPVGCSLWGFYWLV